MNCGSKAMTQKWRPSLSNGSGLVLHAWRRHSKNKTMLTVFFDGEGVVHHEYAPPGQTINKEHYLSVLCRLRDATQQKRPQLWATGNWQLHHDNAPTCVSWLMQTLSVKHHITQVTHRPPYSPDLAPWDFWLFPKLWVKSPLRGKISDYRWDSGISDKTADGDSNKGFCRVFWTVEETLGELCEVPRCWGIIVLCTMFLVSSSITSLFF